MEEETEEKGGSSSCSSTSSQPGIYYYISPLGGRDFYFSSLFASVTSNSNLFEALVLLRKFRVWRGTLGGAELRNTAENIDKYRNTAIGNKIGKYRNTASKVDEIPKSQKRGILFLSLIHI